MKRPSFSIMAGLKLAVLEFLLLLFCLVSPEKQPDVLNVLSILLPYSTAGSANVNFTIRASDGCYKWTSSRPEVAKVRSLLKNSQNQGQTGGDGCSQEAVITSQSSIPEKQTAIIIAEEKVLGNILRADVFVNRINHIEITTTTRELLLGQSPELLDVIAYDDTGNLFSSLDGLVFDWELITVKGSIEASSVLRIVPFAESINETSVAIYALEARGLRGSSIIVEGINTGTAIVKAKLSHSTFKDVEAHSVKLLVIDNIMIVPSMDVYIMINTAVKYNVKRFRQNSVIDIEMPSTQFKFVLSNTTVGTLVEPSSQVIGRSVGYTQVTLVDNNMKDQLSSRQPTAGVHVVQPDHLGFSVFPHGAWVLETNREYIITVDVYDKLNHKLYVAENIMIDTKFPDTYFSVLKSSNNGSYHITKTLRSGKTILNAVLSSVKLLTTGEVVTLNPPVKGQQELVIYDPIAVVPAILVFPWIPVSGEYYRYQLKATGGSGHYTWTSEITVIASVNARGLLTTTTDTGVTQVKAHDSENSMHYGIAEVHVLPPDSLKFIPSRVEVEIGTKLKIPLAAAAYLSPESDELKFFDDCRKMNVSVSVSDPTIFQVIGTSDENDEIMPPGCTSVYLKALRQGFVIVTARYKYKDINIKATVTVAAYIPLKTLDPEDVAVVSLGSAKNLILQGGPQPWVHDRSTHFEKVGGEQEDLISIRSDIIPEHPFGDKRSLHFYHVACKALGEQDLVVTIGNRPSETNKFPASSNVTIKFACMVPATLALEPDVHLPEISERRLSLQDCQSPNKEFHVRSPQALRLRVILRDARNRLFDNFTSLDMSWSTTNHNMASFDLSDTGVRMEYQEDIFRQHLMKSMSYQVCNLKQNQGSVTIKAAVTKYRMEILQNAKVNVKETLKKPLIASLRLSLTSDIRIEPVHASIFNHPMNKVDLTIYGGSGRFLVKGSDDDIASVTAKKSIVKVTPKMTGVLTVTVYDQCLDSPNPATANIRISDIDSIHVTVVDKVELGHVINCTVMVLDELDNPLLVSQLDLLNLTPRLSRDLLNIKPSARKGLDKAFYNLRGVAIGNTILTYSAHPTNKPQITSEPKHIQVFPPLRLDPRYIVLIPGATFQLKATGGPYPQVTTLFSIKNRTVASVDSVGLITARVPGKSTVTGAVEATDPQSGHTIVFSKDQVIVEVLRLSGVKIFTPSTNLVTETEIGLRAVGLNDETPFSFANAIPGLEFQWTSSNIDVCKLKSVYEKSGITIDSEKAFRVVLSCNHPGEVVIKLQAVFTDPSYEQASVLADLYDDVRIQVFEKLRLIHPSDGQLLLPHDVSVRIRTNRDGGRLSYSIMDVCPQSPRSDSRPLLTVDNRGHLETGMISGTAGIVVTSREDFGVNQTVVVHVEVKSVSSISISPLSAVHTLSHKLHAFPVGMSAIFSVFLHDNIGRKFDSGNVPLKHRLNRFDSIHITQGPDNGTYSVRAHNNGEAILNVWLVSSSHIADFVHLRATQAILPFSTTYYLGEMICFKETVMGDEDNGLWWASKDNIISIDQHSGVAIATSSGNTLVYYNASLSLPTYIEAKVSSVSDVNVVNPDKTIVSNCPGTNVNGSYIIYVNFGKQRSTPLVGCTETILKDRPSSGNLEFPFSCALSLENAHGLTTEKVFSITPGYENGKSACFILPRSLHADDARLLSVTKANLLLSVTLQDPSKGTEFSSGLVEVEFIPSFVLDKHEVKLSSTGESVSVEIHGTDEMLLNVQANTQSLLVLVTRRKDEVPNTLTFDISLADSNVPSFDDVIIEVKSRLTTQLDTITVSYLSAQPAPVPQFATSNQCPGPSCPNTHSSTFNFRNLFVILFTILIILLLILICRPRDRQRPSQRPGTSPYGRYSPYPNDSRNALDTSATPYNRSDVSPSRRRQSPLLGRRSTPRSPPLFSVSQ